MKRIAYELYNANLSIRENAQKLFNDTSTSSVRYGAISKYEELLDIIQGV